MQLARLGDGGLVGLGPGLKEGRGGGFGTGVEGADGGANDAEGRLVADAWDGALRYGAALRPKV